MKRFPTGAVMLDMRQLSQGGDEGALTGNQNNQGMQFSSQMAEELLMFDSNASPSTSMDFGGMNPSLSSNITSEFTSILESTSQNSFNMGMGSGAMMTSHSQVNDIFMPDEWSGTTNTQCSGQQQGLQSNSPSQCQSSLSQGQGQGRVLQVQQAGNHDSKTMQQQYGYDKHMWGTSSLQNASELFGMPQQVNQDGILQGGENQSVLGVTQQQQQQQGFQTGLKNYSSKQSSQESASQEIKGVAQPMDYEQHQQRQVANHHGLPQPAIYQRMEVENRLQSFPGSQTTNQQQTMLQRNFVNQPQKVSDNHVLQQGSVQGDSLMQSLRSPGFQTHGVNPQNVFHSQMQTRLMNPSAQTNAHTLSAHQNQGPQGQAHIQSLSHLHGQGQAANPQASVNQQAVFQARHLQSISQQSPFHTNQQAAFHLGQSQINQVHQHAGNSGAQLSGIQHAGQFQARPLNQVLQGLKVGGRQLSQGSPGGGLSFLANNIDSAMRTHMPGHIVNRCLQILTLYIQEQKIRKENKIEFWRDFVQKYFAPGATERVCLSSYNPSQISRNAQGLFPMEYWFCHLCGAQPGRGFENSTDVLPRLFKIKYDSGLLDEDLYLDTAEESYVVAPEKIVLVVSRAVHVSVFPDLRVERYGKLRVTFNNQFKISSWEFCAKVHDELVPRKTLIPQAQQLSSLALESEQDHFDKDEANLKAQCNSFAQCAKQLKTKMEAPNVNDLGFSKRYVRCLQIAEVVNSMKDLISFADKKHLGPIESLDKFPTVRKLQSEGVLQHSSTQVANPLNQGPGNSSSPYATLTTRLPLGAGQGITLNHASSALLQGNDPSLSKPPLAMNQFQVPFRNQVEARNHTLLQPQTNNQMQAASCSHGDTASQGQSQTSNQIVSQFIPQAHSSLEAQHLTQPQSSVSGQIASQILGSQSPNINHMSQQMYDQGIGKPTNFQAPNPVLSQSRSFNRTGQQSLPGTPQSEMSDMRTTA